MYWLYHISRPRGIEARTILKAARWISLIMTKKIEFPGSMSLKLFCQPPSHYSSCYMITIRANMSAQATRWPYGGFPQHSLPAEDAMKMIDSDSMAIGIGMQKRMLMRANRSNWSVITYALSATRRDKDFRILRDLGIHCVNRTEQAMSTTGYGAEPCVCWKWKMGIDCID